jgi:hypothetical protein
VLKRPATDLRASGIASDHLADYPVGAGLAWKEAPFTMADLFPCLVEFDDVGITRVRVPPSDRIRPALRSGTFLSALLDHRSTVSDVATAAAAVEEGSTATGVRWNALQRR